MQYNNELTLEQGKVEGKQRFVIPAKAGIQKSVLKNYVNKGVRIEF